MKLIMRSNQSIDESAHLLRGFFANKFKEYVLLHQHLAKNEFIYNYPYIQYKNINGNPMVIGIKEGVDILQEIYDKYEALNLNGQVYDIVEKNIELREVLFEIVQKFISYSFLTPWLALNERNYGQYQRLESWAKKKEFLEKILIGNIISMSKGLGYTVTEPIKANIGNLREVQTSLKGTPMLGFLGTFSVNFEIPDYWGIGKSVSRGFGTVKKQMPEDRRQRTDAR